MLYIYIVYILMISHADQKNSINFLMALSQQTTSTRLRYCVFNPSIFHFFIFKSHPLRY